MVDAVFYMAKEDAWEESAFLNGKRPNEKEEATKARRNRNTMKGKVWTVVPLHSMGALGVGKTAVDVENNTTGTTIGGAVIVHTVVEAALAHVVFDVDHVFCPAVLAARRPRVVGQAKGLLVRAAFALVVDDVDHALFPAFLAACRARVVGQAKGRSVRAAIAGGLQHCSDCGRNHPWTPAVRSALSPSVP